MHCVHLADLAAVISEHGPAIFYARESVASEAVNAYWISSRNRFELWHQAMARYRHSESSGDFHSLRRWWCEHVIIMEEVLVTDMLTRVVATMAAGMDARSDEDEISPVAQAIHLSHLEARNRVQQIMLFGRGHSVQDAVRLNRLSQGVERWTDALIGRISVDSDDSLQYAINRERAADHADDTRSQGQGPQRKATCWLMNAAMHDMLRRRTSEKTALPEANRAVAKSVMLMLRPELFDSIGTLKSLWLHRLEHSIDGTDRVCDNEMATDSSVEDAIGYQTSGNACMERWYM